MKPTLEIPIPPTKQNLSKGSNVDVLEKIRIRAYELYEQKGARGRARGRGLAES